MALEDLLGFIRNKHEVVPHMVTSHVAPEMIELSVLSLASAFEVR
jgi:hypothetical protein